MFQFILLVSLFAIISAKPLVELDSDELIICEDPISEINCVYITNQVLDQFIKKYTTLKINTTIPKKWKKDFVAPLQEILSEIEKPNKKREPRSIGDNDDTDAETLSLIEELKKLRKRKMSIINNMTQGIFDFFSGTMKWIDDRIKDIARRLKNRKNGSKIDNVKINEIDYSNLLR